jgi:hypothetical protein
MQSMMLGDDVLDEHVPADGRGGRHVGAGLDLVGDDGIGAAAQLAHAADLDDVGARAGDLRAHGVEEVGEVDDMGLLRAVFDDREAAREHRGEQDVHGRADGDDVEIHMAAGQTALGRVGADIAAGLLDGGAHGLEALDVLVDGADAEVAAARHGDACVAEAAQLRADEVIGRANAAHELDGSRDVADVAAVDLDRVAAQAADDRAHVAQDLEKQAHIGNIGYIFNPAGAVHQQRRGENGDGGVFGAGNGDGAVELFAASDQIFNQSKSLFGKSISAIAVLNSAKRHHQENSTARPRSKGKLTIQKQKN